MITLGIDFAAQPRGTAMARVRWSDAAAHVEGVETPATDDDILRAIVGADAVGIDVPFGWPDAFVEFVTRHRADEQSVVTSDANDWRRGLSYRRTDRVVAERFGKWPLSVATDRIALPSMRASALLAAIRERGEAVDRAGGARIAEVYPGLALQVWELRRKYKGTNAQYLPAMVDDLLAAAPWLDLGEHEEECRGNDDVFDAVIAALVARAHALGHWHRPAPEELAQARREGWIVVPSCRLAELLHP